MANLQPLSPQGYNIKDEPYNTNPFWGDDESTDPSVYTRLTELENDVEDLETHKADKSQLDNYYTKVEITDRLNNIPIFDSSLYYNKTQTDTKIDDAKAEVLSSVADGFYNKATVNNLLATKANVSVFNNYYNKTDIDGFIDDLQEDIADANTNANQALTDVGSLNTTVNNLSTTVGDNTGDISNLDTRLSAVESDMTLKASITYVDGQISSMGQSLSNLSGALNDTNNRVSICEGNITALQTQIGDINTILEEVLNGNNS